MLKKYKTILTQAEAEIVEKKSRFIATVRPVKTEEEAKAFIEEMKKKYWNATHNVFAYQIGERNELQRFSDDGEPQGTAGMPVLSVLKGEDIKDTAILAAHFWEQAVWCVRMVILRRRDCLRQGLRSWFCIGNIPFWQHIPIRERCSMKFCRMGMSCLIRFIRSRWNLSFWWKQMRQIALKRK